MLRMDEAFSPVVLRIIQLAPPTLRKLKITTLEDVFNGPDKVAFVNVLPLRFPQLSKLVITGENELSDMCDALEDTLHLMTSLRSIKLTGIVPTPELVYALANLPGLEELWMVNVLETIDVGLDDVQWPCVPGFFPALRSFTAFPPLDIGTAGFISFLAQRPIQLHTLRLTHLYTDDDAPQTHIVMLVQCISRHTALRHLQLGGDNISAIQSDTSTVNRLSRS